MQRRSALKRLGVATIALSSGVPSAVRAGPPSSSGPPADAVVPNDYSMIQDAIDAVDAGDTVVVDGGTYREQVIIHKDVTLKGQAGATIEAPDSVDIFELVESDSTWAPIVFAYGGSESGGEVSGSETVDVEVSGFALDGRGDSSGTDSAVLYRNVGGASPARIAANTVGNLGTPGNTIGIVAYGDSNVRIEDNEVTGFGRGGIGTNGDGGEHPSPNAIIRNNYVDSESDSGGSAPNGVQIGYGATGQVRGNTIRNCRYSDSLDSTWQASGILVFESDGITVQRNTLESNDVAIAASAWGWFADSADGNAVVQNTITDALVGVNLRATAWNPFTSENPSVSNNKVVNNDITGSDGGPADEIGIAIERNVVNDEYKSVVENNKVVQNSITGFEEQVSNEGTETKIQAIEP